MRSSVRSLSLLAVTLATACSASPAPPDPSADAALHLGSLHMDEGTLRSLSAFTEALSTPRL
jgi:hypothetical protein